MKHGDIAYQLEIFPDYLVQMILWEETMNFRHPHRSWFSDNFPISFQAEDMAVMGDVIIGSLKSLRNVYKKEVTFMGFKSDIEIAQECEMLPITKIAEKQVLMTNIWNSTESTKQKN